jgi:hypothetical protein
MTIAANTSVVHSSKYVFVKWVTALKHIKKAAIMKPLFM